ncbi:response regulator [Alteromonas flava]|uniref:response regulator n=1 Tax=Alteromonas flava TaxID=2048003 RepID=UPI0013DD652C|nr:response regulator [Alteromonas flava]
MINVTDSVESIDGRHIVVVDDDVEILEVTKLLLKSDGARVSEFSNAEEALNFISGNADNIDIVMTDQSMRSHMQGDELVQRITASWPAINCLIMTGFAAHKKLERVNVKVMQKPINHSTLVSQLKSFYVKY